MVDDDNGHIVSGPYGPKVVLKGAKTLHLLVYKPKSITTTHLSIYDILSMTKVEDGCGTMNLKCS